MKNSNGEVFSWDYVQSDETIINVINREKHKADKEYLWMVRSVMEKQVIFHYEEGARTGAVIESLANQYHFKGIFNVTFLQAMRHLHTQ